LLSRTGIHPFLEFEKNLDAPLPGDAEIVFDVRSLSLFEAVKFANHSFHFVILPRPGVRTSAPFTLQVARAM